jgi:D-alanine-D-alanine ligase
MKVAVVQNRDYTGVINTFGRPCPEVYGAKTIELVIDSLRQQGHEVLLCEGDIHLLDRLELFMPPGAGGRPGGMVFNMAYGIQGECRYTHVPAMLEMAGMPYTGSSPLGHALALDKVITKDLIRSAGVPTPNYRVMRRAGEHCGDLRFPLVVKPRHESTSFGLHLVNDRRELGEAVEAVAAQYRQDALVEEYIPGREVCVALLGNEELEFLPLVEQDFGGCESCLVTWQDKMHKSAVEPRKVCPAGLPDNLAARLREIAAATFRACHCNDFARVDLRIDHSGQPYVLEINSMASLGSGGSYVLAALTAGYSFAGLIQRILDVAHQRYYGVPVPPPRGSAALEKFVPPPFVSCLKNCEGKINSVPAL